MRSSPVRFLRRPLAALLLVTFPAMTAAMTLSGTRAGTGVHAEAMQGHAHAGHHDGGGPRHHPAHQQCCDLCGAACGCSIHVGAIGFSSPAAVAVTGGAPPLTTRAVPLVPVPHLLPLPLGPPAPLV
jgi:hypothetical protein